MPQGKGTYGNKVGRPSKKNKKLTYKSDPGNPFDLTEKEKEKVFKYKKELKGSEEYQKIMNKNQSLIKSDDEFHNLVLKKVLNERKPKTQAKKSESKQEFNKISQSFDLIGKPTKLTRPGYAGGGKSKRR